MNLSGSSVPDLLGPADGPDETIPTQPVPRDRYLVGLLAPKQSYVSPSRFDAATAADPSGSVSEDHVASPPQLIPSALGLTFAVPAGTAALVVDASWGHYARETVADDADKSIRVWRRSGECPKSGVNSSRSLLLYSTWFSRSLQVPSMLHSCSIVQ